jgi:hypothetical protein
MAIYRQDNPYRRGGQNRDTCGHYGDEHDRDRSCRNSNRNRLLRDEAGPQEPQERSRSHGVKTPGANITESIARQRADQGCEIPPYV